MIFGVLLHLTVIALLATVVHAMVARPDLTRQLAFYGACACPRRALRPFPP